MTEQFHVFLINSGIFLSRRRLDDPATRQRRDAYAFTAAADLRRAVGLAVASLGALALTVGFIWLLPQESSAASTRHPSAVSLTHGEAGYP
ncbi:hypothetical protein F7Q99_03345 [Streptomyces kaniharaensis]|uniref:Uncharacterized protein n=1 Tax=Streptomyces kaniharaensis TaxID=212423 RepID=A0A6N7KIM2_9ACTN|nr:hypothetical protein [Streptomyces kaniharaensis]MQS11350.1 hypothetical protein [Streptomyces kaniharaensis]